jgi:hypothetical protein
MLKLWASLLVRVAAAGESGTGARRGWWPAVVQRSPSACNLYKRAVHHSASKAAPHPTDGERPLLLARVQSCIVVSMVSRRPVRMFSDLACDPIWPFLPTIMKERIRGCSVKFLALGYNRINAPSCRSAPPADRIAGLISRPGERNRSRHWAWNGIQVSTKVLGAEAS